MNAARRKQLASAVKLIEQAQAIIQEAASDEQDAFDNLPESLQDGDRGQTMQDAISALESADGACDELTGFVEEAAA